MLLRSMSPSVVAVDELGGVERKRMGIPHDSVPKEVTA